MSQREQILTRIAEATDIPPFPEIVIKLKSLLEDEETPSEAIVNLVKYDPAISGGILRLANTLAFNISGRESTVEGAVVRIGYSNIKNLVMTLALMKSFSKSKRIDLHKFWNHSVSVAFAAQIVSKYAKKVNEDTDELYTAGLLHELGILIIDNYLGDLYDEVLPLVGEKEIMLFEAENRVLGINHAEVGAYLFRKWNMPDSIIDTVLYQYSPDGHHGKTEHMLHIAKVANFICGNQGIDNGIDMNYSMALVEGAWERIGLNIESTPRILKEVTEELKKAREILEVSKMMT